MRLRYAVEEEPLGTAGPTRLALDEGLLADSLFVLNGDVLSEMDLTAQLARHAQTGARATIALIEVADTASYGVVPTDGEGHVEAFLEKSDGPAPTNRINAGAYVIEREVIERLVPAGRAVSFEREVFPALVGDGLYGFPAAGYWMDIGTPDRYLEATWDLLSGTPSSALAPRDETGSLVEPGCLTAGAHIGPQSVLGAHCSVGNGTTVERSVLHERVTVGEDCVLRECVLADGVRVGSGSRIEPGAMVGARATVAEGAAIGAGVKVEPDAHVAA
jgi:mannose-1-phosphate guanylyltransferase